MRVAIVGAGMAGLSAAVDLLDAGAAVVLVDAAPRAGGKVVTERVDGFTIEHGPDSFVSYRPAAAELAGRFGLGEQIISVTEPRVVHLRSADQMVPPAQQEVRPSRWSSRTASRPSVRVSTW